MIKHCIPIKVEVGVLVLQNLFPNTYDLIIIAKIPNTQSGFEFNKQEEVK